MGYPYKSGYVGQIHADGWGWDDCAEASAVRLLREAGKLDSAGAHLAQINQVRHDMTGNWDSPYNGFTYSDQIVRGLGVYGIQSHWSDAYGDAHAAPWSLVVVAAEPMLADGSYAYNPGALGGGTHVCLWMPDGLVDDPLAELGGFGDVRWDLGSLQSVFLGAVIVDTEVGAAWPPLPPPPPAKPLLARRRTAAVRLGLKPAPEHGGPNRVTIPAGGELLDTGKRHLEWEEVYYGSHAVGYWVWVPAAGLLEK